MNKGKLLYEGKAKRIYETDNPYYVWIEYKNSVTAFNAEKKAELDGKGRLNNEITCLLFEKLTNAGIKHHFVKRLSSTEQLVKKVKIIPLEVVVRHVIAGSLSKRLGKEEGIQLEQPIVEFYYKEDALGDPLVTEDHIRLLDIATPKQLETLKELAIQISTLLRDCFLDLGINLVDIKLEFGIDTEGEIILADELSPDNCRLWDMATNEKMDKDVFRCDLGNLLDTYEEILDRLQK